MKNSSGKQRLFEVMSRLDKTFKPNLNESKIYVKPTEIPSQILDWAKSIIGSGFQNKITVEKSNGEVEIGMPWHDADRETHQFFKLIDNGAAEMGKSVSRSGWGEVNTGDVYGKVPIPSGYVLATVGTYPKRLEIITSPDAMNMISNNDYAINKLSDEALIALLQARKFKPAYRQKFGDSVYQELIASGSMNSQKAITIQGRNLINSPEAEERLKQIAEKDRKENGQWTPKYKL